MNTKTQRKAKILEVPPIAEDLKKTIDPSKVAVWERRMVNPGQEPSSPINLTTPGFVTRWVDTSVGGRFARATNQQGWTVVKADELVTGAELQGFMVGTDGSIRRGERNAMILMKMPEVVFKALQKRKAEIELASLRKTRKHLAEAAANMFGGQAGDFVMGSDVAEGISGLKGKVVDSKERIGLESDQDSF